MENSDGGCKITNNVHGNASGRFSTRHLNNSVQLEIVFFLLLVNVQVTRRRGSFPFLHCQAGGWTQRRSGRFWRHPDLGRTPEPEHKRLDSP